MRGGVVMKNKVTIIGLLLVFLIVVLVGSYILEENRKANTYVLRVFSTTERTEMTNIYREDIYAEEYWKKTVELYSDDLCQPYLELDQSDEWIKIEDTPLRKADEVITVNHKYSGYVHWKVWIQEDEVLIEKSYPNKTMQVKRTLNDFKDLPRTRN